MRQVAKQDLFETASIPKAVATLAIPTILSSLVMVVYNVADTYFVGLLDDAVETAGVTLAAPMLLAFNAVNNLFGIGASSAMSRALGQGKSDKARQCSALGFYCAFLAALLFSLLTFVGQNPLLQLLGANAETVEATRGYLLWAVTINAAPAILNVVLAYLVRAEGAAFHASAGTMLGCLLNIALDPLFILPWGFAMGAAGAGVATFISNLTACAYFAVLLYCKRKQTIVSVALKDLSFDREMMRDILSVGVPASIQNLLNVTGMTVYNNFASAYGSNVVAAMGIVQKIQLLPIQITMGASQGVMPFIGYNYAAKQLQRMREATLFLLKCLVPFLLVVAAFCSVFAAPLVGLFMKDPEVIFYGRQFMWGFALALPFLCFDYTTVAVFQAIGAGRKSLHFAFLRKIVLEIPAIIALNFLIPVYGIAYASLTAEIVMTILAFKALKDTLTERWNTI